MTAIAPQKIVIADDDPDIRELLAVAVRKAGHEVLFAAADGLSALTAAQDATAAMAILDISMPNMTGLEVCAALRSDKKTAHIRIILVSAGVQDSAVQIGLAAGADRYLTKPFSPKSLALVIRELLTEPSANGNNA